MLLWIGAALCGFLGYRLYGWWVPAAAAAAVVAVQAVMFRVVLGDQGSGYELLAVSLFMNLLMFHATFGIGRAIAQRLGQRRKGVR